MDQFFQGLSGAIINVVELWQNAGQPLNADLLNALGLVSWQHSVSSIVSAVSTSSTSTVCTTCHILVSTLIIILSDIIEIRDFKETQNL